ncbi:hypothetical protein N7494_007756 [Penicillium frequentans]|uniref:Extracellular membrane protein CFEM domain-containing protein n=1 Tax=Penicillium frequentans TaxID=3151616 RepID=A0AAD6CT38_9EURO|nr:hypothetical protein N7494_007756 [Penicillium glabrum]
MRLTLLAIAGTILSAAADSPLRVLTHKSNDINDLALLCIQDIDYTPPCDTNSAACWFKDTSVLSQVIHCIKDASSGSLESTLSKFQKWCNLKTPNESTLVPYKSHGAHISLRSAINHLSKRYGGYHQPSNGISWQAIMGICAGVEVALRRELILGLRLLVLNKVLGLRHLRHLTLENRKQLM